jgi:hypothetical protein
MHKGESPSLWRRIISVSQARPAYLIAAAALLHLVLTLTIYLIGRFALLPNVFDANGTGIFFATDGFVYRLESISMARILTGEGFMAWLMTPAPLHVRAYSLSLTVFGPLFGFNVLSAEPLNLSCYLAILVLVFRLGREVFDRRAGLLAAGMVALWPSFLIHTTQLLRDPMFMAAMLALSLICVRWLTRDYSWRSSVVVGIVGGMLIILLWMIRKNMWGVVALVVLLGTMLFVVRQVRERRIMGGNLAGVVLLLVLMACAPRFAPRPVDHITQPNGAPLVQEQDLPPAALGSVPILTHRPQKASTFWGEVTRRIRNARAGFKEQFPRAGSNIDPDAQFNGFGDVIRYLPRALAIGLFAPFPNMWFAAGERIGLSGRLLSGMEMLTLYFIELLALVGLWQSRRRLPAWLLFLIFVVGVTTLGMVVVNVAALYRMRYIFLMLLILLGAHGAIETKAILSSRKRTGESTTPAYNHAQASATEKEILTAEDAAGTQRKLK